eukprot:5793740-Pyramimonas_sp.AAC.1
MRGTNVQNVGVTNKGVSRVLKLPPWMAGSSSPSRKSSCENVPPPDHTMPWLVLVLHTISNHPMPGVHPSGTQDAHVAWHDWVLYEGRGQAMASYDLEEERCRTRIFCSVKRNRPSTEATLVHLSCRTGFGSLSRFPVTVISGRD